MSTPTLEDKAVATPTSDRFAGIIGVEGEATGDGRLIQSGALRWDTLPIPLRYVSADVGGHDGAVVVGAIESIFRRDDGTLWATGRFDTSDQAQEAKRLMGEHMLNGVSMDLDDVSFEVRVAQELVPEEGDDGDVIMLAKDTGDAKREVDENGKVTVVTVKSDDEVMVTTGGRVRAATQVAIPAFNRAMLYLADDTNALSALTAADGDNPMDGDGNALWDQAMAALEAVDDLEFLSPEYLAATDAAGDLFAEAAIALQDSDPERAALAAETAAKLKRFASLPWDPANVETRESGPTLDDEQGGTGAMPEGDSLVAGAAPIAPPEEWFDDPGLTEPTALVVTKAGQVYGHLATWDVCHVASPAGPGICITAPHSARNYLDFHLGSVLTEEDTLVATGKITMGTGHAPHKMNASQAAAHYDNTGTAIADVRAGEDMYGIWVAGALRPEATPEQIRALRASPLSGDWREVGGALELKAALAVNVPGFPVPRPAGLVASGGDRLLTLVASGMVPSERQATVDPPGTPGALSAADVDYLHRLVQRNRNQDAAALRAEVDAVRNRQKVQAFAAMRKKG